MPTPTFALASGAPAWLAVGAGSGVVSGTPPSGTTAFTYSVVASNGVSPSATAGPFVVKVSPATAAPAFTAAAPPLTATVGTSYAYTFTASGTPTPTFALTPGAPAWLAIGGSSGTVSGTPPSGTTTFTYSVVASNGVSPDATAGPFTVAVTAATGQTADLAIALSGPTTAAKGSTVTYTATVTNGGPAPAVKALVVLAAGPGAKVVGATPGGGEGAAGLWTWELPSVASGQSLTFSVNVKVSMAGTVIGAATVGSTTRDPRLTNNLSVVSTAVK